MRGHIWESSPNSEWWGKTQGRTMTGTITFRSAAGPWSGKFEVFWSEVLISKLSNTSFSLKAFSFFSYSQVSEFPTCVCVFRTKSLNIGSKEGGNPGPQEGRNTEEPASLPDTSTCQPPLLPSYTFPAPYNSVIYPSGPSIPLPSCPSNRQHSGIPALFTRRRVKPSHHRGRDCYRRVRVCASVRGLPPTTYLRRHRVAIVTPVSTSTDTLHTHTHTSSTNTHTHT